MTVRARQIVAVSPDDGFGKQLATALEPVGGAVELHHALGSLGTTAAGAALCVIHLDGGVADLVPHLAAGPPVIAVLPGPDLAAVVELMRSSDRVAGVMVAAAFAPRQLVAMATRIVTDDVFGLDQALVPGTQIHSHVVGDHRDKSRCMARVSEFVERIGAPRRYREPIEQCLDEMVMNALYDAPVDADGEHIFAGIPPRTRIELRSEHSVVVQYGCDGERLALAVRDAFGSLDKDTVLRNLHKGLHAEQQIDLKAGGAGLGLYLMANSATAVYFNVLPGVATEAICMFDLAAPRLQLEQFGVFVQRDAAGRLATGPSRVLRAGHRRAGRGVVAMIAAACVVLGIVAWPRIFGGDGTAQVTVTAVPEGATIELDSEPTGATVEIDGEPMGTTPLTLTTLMPGSTVSVSFARTGYRLAASSLHVPAAGERLRVVQPLELSDDFVRVSFVSEPPGAEIIRTGQLHTVDRTYTPAELFLEVDTVQRFTLTMPNHVPLVIEPFTPARGGPGLVKGGELVDGATLRIEATVAGTATVSGAPHCTDVALPFDCTVAPGTYVVAYLGPGAAAVTRTVTVPASGAIAKFALGLDP